MDINVVVVEQLNNLKKVYKKESILVKNRFFFICFFREEIFIVNLKLRHIVALNDKGLNIKNYELIGESECYFKFRNKENKKIISIRY